MNALSSYRFMWLMVMFDLPVVSKNERRSASEFRNNLLDKGFEMIQFSVYLKFCSSRAKLKSISLAIKKDLPEHGKVTFLQFTDRQYEDVENFVNLSKRPSKQPPPQFVLF